MTTLAPSYALLQQLQQRLTHLANITNSEHLPAIQTLIAALYHAQQQGSGVLLLQEIATLLPVKFANLCHTYPTLIGTTNAATPIVIFDEFVAFRRTYRQLCDITDALLSRDTYDPPSKQALANISWYSNFTLSDEQKLAAFTAASLPFCVITGGAGTGKTTTLSKALELILLDNPSCDILLAAPTGKAAQRLNEALAQQLKHVNSKVKNTLSDLHAKTLHHLLGVSEHSGHTLHHTDNPLCCDVLAIDEASMIGSDLFAQTLAALPTQAKLILLGDAHQLPPINSVAFFNDISKLSPSYHPNFAEAVYLGLSQQLPPSSLNPHAPLVNALCRLTVAKRFKQQSLIERCAEAVLQHNPNTLINALGSNLHEIPPPKALYQQLADTYPQDKHDLLSTLSQRMILCANRQGAYGSKVINAQLDQVFRYIITGKNNETWYEGRQILIEKNYPDLQLNNGDIGRCFMTNRQWQVDFGNGRILPVELLPHDYSLAFAISIHKSQGSEYTHIDMVLGQFDAQQPNKLISTALIYTGITRAKQSLTIFADQLLLQQALSSADEESASPLLRLLSCKSIF